MQHFTHLLLGKSLQKVQSTVCVMHVHDSYRDVGVFLWTAGKINMRHLNQRRFTPQQRDTQM